MASTWDKNYTWGEGRQESSHCSLWVTAATQVIAFHQVDQGNKHKTKQATLKNYTCHLENNSGLGTESEDAVAAHEITPSCA